jgi:inositol-phosphate transport system ATP-binding protein
MKVELEALSKYFGSVVAVDDVTLDIQDGEFIAFLGPSGCGKTTTLLMIAGIYKPSTGVVRFDERVVNHLPPRDRNVGMVFQSYALYPHMTVYENLVFPLRLKRVPKVEMRARAERAADILGIGQLMDRRPGQLSGGQQQRVALGRALAKEPSLLLFDEPLSNLDARLRLSMRGEIKRLQMDLGITSIYVTHDQVEAMTMADRIAVIKDGKLQAYAVPDVLYDQPRTLFIAGFVGNPPMNFLEVEVLRDDDRYHARSGLLDIIIPDDVGEKVAGRGPVILGIRPEDVSPVPEPQGLRGEVYVVEPLGRDDLLDVHVGKHSLHVLADPSLNLQIGDPVHIQLNANKLQFFDPQTEHSLLWA